MKVLFKRKRGKVEEAAKNIRLMCHNAMKDKRKGKDWGEKKSRWKGNYENEVEDRWGEGWKWKRGYRLLMGSGGCTSLGDYI